MRSPESLATMPGDPASPASVRVGIVIQARLGSNRLPRKVLRPVFGKPLLQRLCDRIGLSRETGVVVVATSDRPTDDAIARACDDWGVPVFRGPEDDVLARMTGAARAFGLTALVRVTADHPLTAPDGIDEVVRAFARSGAQYVHNCHRGGYPYGTGAEMISAAALESCDREATVPGEREHVTPMIRRNPGRFHTLRVDAPTEIC